MYIHKKLRIFLLEATIPRVEIFSKQHCKVDLYQVCSNHGHFVNNVLGPQVTRFYKDLFRENFKESFCQTENPRA